MTDILDDVLGPYERPTVHHLLSESDTADYFLTRLTINGYRIVHPDDVPEQSKDDPGWDYNGTWGEGWNACRAHIFGEGT